MPDEPLRVLEDPAEADLAFVENQINEHNADVTGHRDGRGKVNRGRRVRARLIRHRSVLAAGYS